MRATLSILTATFRAPEARNRALAIWTAVAIGGGAVGGLLGGVLTGGLSWRWIFFVNVPVGAVLMALAVALLPGDERVTGPRRLDLGGAVTVTGGLIALVWALIRAGEVGWGASDVVGGLVLGVALLAAFAMLETHVASAPLVPFTLFRSRLLSAGNLLSFLSFVPVMATWYFLTLYLQGVRGATPTEAGLLFLPLSAAVIAASQLGFRLILRLDARAVVGAGGVIAAAGLAWLARWAPGTDLVWVIAPASVAMAGGGLMFAPITVAATSALPPRYGGLAGGLLNTTRQIGGALGLAVLGTIAAQPADPTAGYASAVRAGAAVFLVTAAAGSLLLPARLRRPRSP